MSKGEGTSSADFGGCNIFQMIGCDGRKGEGFYVNNRWAPPLSVLFSILSSGPSSCLMCSRRVYPKTPIQKASVQGSQFSVTWCRKCLRLRKDRHLYCFLNCDCRHFSWDTPLRCDTLQRAAGAAIPPPTPPLWLQYADLVGCGAMGRDT